ncbi:metallophosphoesterase family protein [Gorillibacterium timonense]|uniref:metallophosphoesterase family protein n=1 Tax=Gorillibacterium timonense TaxID=1689269 RepID=UPI00071C7531|nr:metallophosphoesterase [Gorillibacterium timonense]
MGHERMERGRECLLSFQVITDTHVTANPKHSYNKNLEQALEDIAVQAPNTDGIMHVGDVTHHGFKREYREWNRIWDQFQDVLPSPFVATGNHDIGLGFWRYRLAGFLRGTGMRGAYHDHWIRGHHFIFLGSEKSLKLHCSLSGQQLDWLDAKLGEGAVAGRPVFVFLHQPLLNTVSGSYQDQGWSGVREDRELRAVLARHPQAILFTGHTHWELESRNCCFQGKEGFPSLFNAASVAYLWSDSGKHVTGSQGFYIEVYPGRVLIRGRNFTQGEWVEKAQFVIEYESWSQEVG